MPRGRRARADSMQEVRACAGTNAGNLIQRIAAQIFLALCPMSANREPVRLVAQPLQIIQNRRICRQHEIIRPVPEETLATGIPIGAFGNANQRNIVKAKLRKHIMGDV